MAGYTKVFGTLLDSSVWGLSKDARILWITLLLKKDRQQMVHASIPGLAHVARLTVEETEAALKELEKPDPYSQTKDCEGRRIVEKDGGWFVVNGAKYREMLNQEARLAYQAEWVRKKRMANRGTPLKGEESYVKDAKAGKEGEAEDYAAHL